MEPTFTCVSSSLLVVQIIELYKKKRANHSCFFCPFDIIYDPKKKLEQEINKNKIITC